MAYTNDLNTIHNPATGTNPPASWGDAIRDNFLCVERVISHTVLGSANAAISSGTLATVTNGWKLRAVARVQLTSGTGVSAGMRFNSDSGSNYVRQYVFANNATVTADEVAATTEFIFMSASSSSASRWQTGEVEVFDYLGSGHKAGFGKGWDQRAMDAASALLLFTGFNWASTSAITSVSLHAASSTFVSGSSLTILATPSV